MTLIGFAACGVYKSQYFPAGKYQRITNPTDYKGQICGYDDAVLNKPNAYFMLDGTGKHIAYIDLFLLLTHIVFLFIHFGSLTHTHSLFLCSCVRIFVPKFYILRQSHMQI